MIKSQLTLHDQLKSLFGFNSFKGRQEEIIKNLQDGNDSLVIMPTGGGKSMCFQLPALLLDGCAIVVSPLIALIINIEPADVSNIILELGFFINLFECLSIKKLK